MSVQLQHSFSQVFIGACLYSFTTPFTQHASEDGFRCTISDIAKSLISKLFGIIIFSSVSSYLRRYNCIVFQKQKRKYYNMKALKKIKHNFSYFMALKNYLDSNPDVQVATSGLKAQLCIQTADSHIVPFILHGCLYRNAVDII